MLCAQPLASGQKNTCSRSGERSHSTPRARSAGIRAVRTSVRSRPADPRPSSFCAEAQPESQNPGSRSSLNRGVLGPATTRRMTSQGDAECWMAPRSACGGVGPDGSDGVQRLCVGRRRVGERVPDCYALVQARGPRAERCPGSCDYAQDDEGRVATGRERTRGSACRDADGTGPRGAYCRSRKRRQEFFCLDGGGRAEGVSVTAPQVVIHSLPGG